MELITPIFLIFYVFAVWTKTKQKKNRINVQKDFMAAEFVVFILYSIFCFQFFISLSFYTARYTEAIDPIENDYSPFSHQHIPSLLTFYILFFTASWLVWIKGEKLPPLFAVICKSLILIGIVLNIVVILQMTSRSKDDMFIQDSIHFELMLFPICGIIVSILLLVRSIQKEAANSGKRIYKNKILNFLNTIILNSKFKPLWMLVLLFPLFLIVTFILTLFGQSPDALVKVFTETTTWTMSQKTHPPYLGHEGHYLCTVAACGNPKIVKPIRLGTRHGNTIIINRQLMIANAYEEMIRDYSPRFHRIIRLIYDKYGYAFSKHINSPALSNATYFLMKPLEWIFLLKLYIFCSEPEKKISKQYL